MRTDEEKKIWREKMNKLVKQVSALTPEDRQAIANRMPIITCEGHALSVYNQCFLVCQTNLALTIVGGYRQWSKAGRQVTKGEHAIGYIYVPLIPKREEDSDAEQDIHFRLVPVFDVSQTEPSNTQQVA